MTRLRPLLRASAVLVLVLCLVAALFVLGAHVDQGHDHHACPVCAMLCVGLGLMPVVYTALVAVRPLCAKIGRAVAAPILRHFFVRLN